MGSVVSATCRGRVSRLSSPALTSKFGDGISWSGQTFDGSIDGKPRGLRREENVAAEKSGDSTCFLVDLDPLSAAMLHVDVPVRATQQQSSETRPPVLGLILQLCSYI